jgi:outer membrane protein OmpA-like peptidoglycan-associated protein
MKNNRILPLTLIVAAVLAGCSSLPANNSQLDEARHDYANAQANPQVTSLAAGELKQASTSLDKANNAWSKNEDKPVVDHLAYVAKQEVAIARQTADQKTAELAVTNAASERDAVRLEARTREAEAAQRSAQYSQARSEASQRSAEQSRRDSEASRLSAEASQRQANAERQAVTVAEKDARDARQVAMDAQSRSMLLESRLSAMEAKKTERGMVVTIGDVLFDTNEAQLKSGGVRNVQKLADFFKEYPRRNVMIEGFTDSTGSDSLNQQLSDRRADSVRTALLGMGMNSDRITSRGYGEAYPVAGNDTAAGRQLNRRVELVVSEDGGKIAPR